MSATLFGGSFGLVINEDPHVKNLFLDRLRRVYIDVAFPFLKYIPWVPSPVAEMDRMIHGIIETRRAEMMKRRGENKESEKEEEKMDLLQIFLNANENDPTGFTDKHLMEEMRLFMYVPPPISSFLLPNSCKPDGLTKFPGLPAATQQAQRAPSHSFSSSTIPPNFNNSPKKSSPHFHLRMTPSHSRILKNYHI